MNRGSNKTGLAIVVTSLCWTLAGLAAALPAETEHLQKMGALEMGKPVPWFAAYEVWGEGELYNLNTVLKDPGSLKVALVFFTTYCEPCRAGLLMLKDARAQLEQAQLKVVLVDVGEEPEEVARYLKELGLDGFIAIADRYSVIAKKYGLSVVRDDQELLEIPKSVVFDKKGILRDILGKEGRDYVSALAGSADAVMAETSTDLLIDLTK